MLSLVSLDRVAADEPPGVPVICDYGLLLPFFVFSTTFCFAMKRVLGLALLLAAFTACNRTPKALDPMAASATKAQLAVLRDSVDSRWTQMIASDDAKIVATSQILNELERSPGASQQQLRQLNQANSRLQALRYQQLTMQSAQIDRYDTVQDSLLAALRSLVAAPGASAPSSTVQNTFDTISQYDGQVVSYRVQYDQAAKQFNSYLQLHQSQLQNLGGQYAQLAPLPLFELQE